MRFLSVLNYFVYIFSKLPLFTLLNEKEISTRMYCSINQCCMLGKKGRLTLGVSYLSPNVFSVLICVAKRNTFSVLSFRMHFSLYFASKNFGDKAFNVHHRKMAMYHYCNLQLTDSWFSFLFVYKVTSIAIIHEMHHKCSNL